MKKKSVLIAGSICLMVIFTLITFTKASVLAAQKTRTIVCTVHLPPPPAPPAKPSAHIKAYLDYSKRVQEATGGRIKIVYRWGSSLGKVSDFLTMVGNPGMADAGVICTVYHKWEIPLTAGTGLPFIVSNLEAQVRSFMDLYNSWAPLRDEWSKVNCEVIWTTPTPNCSLGTKDKPIKTLSDFKGRKIWGVGYYANAMNQLGTKVISFPAGDIFQSLAKGVIQGAFFPYTGMHMFGFWEELKYIVNTDKVGAHANMIWAINKDVWRQISEEDRKIMKKIGSEAFEQFLVDYEAENVRINKVFEEKGIKFNELSAADWSEWENLAGPPEENAWLAEMEKRGQKDNAIEALKRYKELVKKYEAKAKHRFIFPE